VARAEPYLEQAQDDATLIAIRDMERAGIDIITDGEMRRESYSNRFATALDGIDIDTPAVVRNRAGSDTVVPRAVGKVRRREPVECATCSSCAATPASSPRSRCPVRSP
jgi:5-methyltetrahydropteroyltriglutamate--homocysteine methyltransferase